MKTTPTPSLLLPNRRQFLRTSAATGVAVSLGTLDLARTAYAAGNETLKVGMIGCGGRNTGAGAQALKADPGAKLVAMCDIFMDRIKGARGQIQNELAKSQKADQVAVDDDHCFTGLDGYNRVIEASDVVLIANAAKFHPYHTLAAINAGKHVFTEKPHGIDPFGIKIMQRACTLAKEKKLSVMSGLHSRHHTGYAETVQRIHDGQIGDIVSIEENFLRAPYGITERNPAHSELEWQFSTQYHFVWLSGDDVVQSLVHNLDRASWAMHEAVPEKCHGLGGRSSMVEGRYGNVFDHHSVVYQFPNNVRLYALCRTTTFCYDEYSSLVFGTKGRANIMGCSISGEKSWRWNGQCDPYQLEHNKLFAAIRSGEPINCGDYMCRSTMMGIMGQISCYTGKEITWEQINASEFAYPPTVAECRDGMEAPVKPGPNGSYPIYAPGQTKLI